MRRSVPQFISLQALKSRVEWSAKIIEILLCPINTNTIEATAERKGRSSKGCQATLRCPAIPFSTVLSYTADARQGSGKQVKRGGPDRVVQGSKARSPGREVDPRGTRSGVPPDLILVEETSIPPTRWSWCQSPRPDDYFRPTRRTCHTGWDSWLYATRRTLRPTSDSHSTSGSRTPRSVLQTAIVQPFSHFEMKHFGKI